MAFHTAQEVNNPKWTQGKESKLGENKDTFCARGELD